MVSSDSPTNGKSLLYSKKLAYSLLVALIVYSVVRSLVAAQGNPLWYDELFTFMMAKQGGWTAIVNALRVPLDGHPPLFFLIEHYATNLVKNQEVALRLPSIPVTLVCVFLYASRKAGEVVALLCTALLLLSNLFQYYVIEARPYSLVACISFALLCYQRADSSRWATLLAVSLVLAESFHYLAGVAMIPFGLAESVVLITTKRIRWRVWGAFVVAVVPLALCWKFVAAFKTRFGPGLYSRLFKFSGIPGIYGDLFMTNSKVGFGSGFDRNDRGLYPTAAEKIGNKL